MGVISDTTTTPPNKQKELAFGVIKLCEPHFGEGGWRRPHGLAIIF